MITLKALYKKAGFKPNFNQQRAINHIDGPLFLMAGPGSGKTRVLLWRTVNLIVFHNVKPDEIFLSTFTEKAANQLKEGLLSLLGMVTNETRQAYDISQMYIGTVHSLCQRMISDRRFSISGRRNRAPILLDELDQYFHLYNTGFWQKAKQDLNIDKDIKDIFSTINRYMNTPSESKHKAVENCISLFNRFSEESLNMNLIRNSNCDEELKLLSKLYTYYLNSLRIGNRRLIDFSLLQQEGYRVLLENPDSIKVFKHIIIDEYQDTNSIQEKIFFKLAQGQNNICVVGDDDQALYRFRGATVENFVCFPERCNTYLNQSVTSIPLNINYRSKCSIVDFYCNFINQEDWTKDEYSKTFYRLVDKDIQSNDKGETPLVAATTQGDSYSACDEIAGLVVKLIDEKKVADPNQIAFLYPSLKSVTVGRMIDALESRGLKVYAPRAKQFLANPEPTAVFGLFAKVFGKQKRNLRFDFGDNKSYHDWLDQCETIANELLDKDKNLAEFITDKQNEVEGVINDYCILLQELQSYKWELTDEYDVVKHRDILCKSNGLSIRAKKELQSKRLESTIKRRENGVSTSIQKIINRITSLDWNLLDLFYRLCGFDYFKEMFDIASTGKDEGPVCNLSLTSHYLDRFVDKYYSVIGGYSLIDKKFRNVLFNSFLSALYRRGETEYEDSDDPFPKGRIPFLTIHQSKGLEFPVVVIGNPTRGKTQPQRTEEIVRPFLTGDYEPLDKVPVFDKMRMYYVALSRAKNLLVVANMRGQGLSVHPHFRTMLQDSSIPRIPELDISTVPDAKEEVNEIYRTFSYTSDYITYHDCPRRYMVFRKYNFAPSRSTTMFFGSLVHQTIEDLHQRLIAMGKEEE